MVPTSDPAERGRVDRIGMPQRKKTGSPTATMGLGCVKNPSAGHFRARLIQPECCSPHETFTKATHLILFLRAEDWLSRFYAARVKTGKSRSEQMFSGLPPKPDSPNEFSGAADRDRAATPLAPRDYAPRRRALDQVPRLNSSRSRINSPAALRTHRPNSDYGRRHAAASTRAEPGTTPTRRGCVAGNGIF